MLIKGTMVDIGMLNFLLDVVFVCFIIDGCEEEDGEGWVGLCVVDCGMGCFFVGVWCDDEGVSCLRIVFAELRLVEILVLFIGLSV